MKRPLLNLICWYTGVTFLFACVYLAAWHFIPDAFLVNDEFNRYPTAYLEEMAAFAPPQDKAIGGSAESDHPSALASELRIESEKLKKEWLIAMKALNELPKTRQRIENQQKQIIEELETSRELQIDAYRNQVMKPYLDREQELSKAVNEADAKTEKESNPALRTSLIKAAGQANIDLSNAKVATARQALQVANHIVNEYGSFGDPELLKKLRHTQNQLMALLDEELKSHSPFADISNKALDLLRRQHESIRKRIGFVDFLYFSMGVATTTTFGDIMPNARSARLLVFCQLFICAALFGVLLSRLGDIISAQSPQPKNLPSKVE